MLAAPWRRSADPRAPRRRVGAGGRRLATLHGVRRRDDLRVGHQGGAPRGRPRQVPTHLPARAPPGLARRRWLQRLEGLTWLKGTNRLKGLKGQRVSPWLAALTQELPRGWRRGHTDGVLALAKGGTLLYSGGYDHCIKVPRPWNRWVTLEPLGHLGAIRPASARARGPGRSRPAGARRNAVGPNQIKPNI